MQHGQKITRQPKELLAKAGFDVREPREGHLCCGSAGTYNILQPEISARLRDRKVRNIEATGADDRRHRQYRLHDPDRRGAGMPVVHTVELLDWAYGGKRTGGDLTAIKRKRAGGCFCAAPPFPDGVALVAHGPSPEPSD